MMQVPYLAQTTLGGCGACSFIMAARFFNPLLQLTEETALQSFGVDGFGPRCFDLSTSFYKAAVALGMVTRVTELTREGLRAHLAAGPVILYHRASQATDAVPHFSVAVAASDTSITRHDPGLGAGLVDAWGNFAPLWDAAKVTWWPYRGCQAALLRPN
jgi:ABC-type bacteriocin/lantibiotic exporter with double-glycine peptidase domain